MIYSRFIFRRLRSRFSFGAAVASLFVLAAHGHAANQTAILSPVNVSPSLPYRIELQSYDFGAGSLPTLQSFAVGEADGKWLLVGGRTNGLHGFNGAMPDQNLPPQFENRDVWVVDVANEQSWHRSLDDASSGLSTTAIAALSSANTQAYQVGNKLYVTGGYGTDELGNYLTFDTLTSIDVPGLENWVINGGGTAASQIRQIHDPLVQVTDGDMYEVNGRTQLVFGQDFVGAHKPSSNGVYTRQVRSFDIVDDGTNLAIINSTSTAPDDNFRRRDLNVFPTIRPDAGGVKQGLEVLSGVFPATNGASTVPIEIDAAGNPTMADPSAAGTFK